MKRSNILIIFICTLIIFSGTAYAKQLTVKKIIPSTDIETGDSVSISLEFDNPFNKSIPVTIQDTNILGNNGLDIQCYEYTLPDNPRMSISYDFPIQAYSSGDFTLNQATVTYINPETGTQESVESEPVTISIKPGKSTGQMQGITKIYSCSGMNIQSTSISSSSSTSISISSGSQQTVQNNNPQTPSSPEDIQQGAQDMQNIKQEMEKQQQEQQKMENIQKQSTEDIKKLEKAVEMFNNGRQKEAYIEASNALRFYFKGTSGINEYTSDEIIRTIRGSKDEEYLRDVKECFMLCDLVKFAKYEPDARDFKRVVDYARRIIEETGK
jgi:hypothetical protein